MALFAGSPRFRRFARYPGGVWYYSETPDLGLALSKNLARNRVLLGLGDFDGQVDLYRHRDADTAANGLLFPFIARRDRPGAVWKVVVLPPTHALAVSEVFSFDELLDALPQRHLTSVMGKPEAGDPLPRQFARSVREWCQELEAQTTAAQVPATQEYLLPAQVPAVGRGLALAARFKVSVNMSRTGAGKSTMCAAIAAAYPEHLVTVLAPLAAVKVWHVALARAGVVGAEIHTYSMLSTHETDWTSARPRFVIVDECHSIKNPASNVGKVVMALLATDCKAIMVSATLSEGFVKKDLYYLFKALALERFGLHDELVQAMLKGARQGQQPFRDAAIAIIEAFSVRLDLVIEHQQQHVLHAIESAVAARRSTEAWRELYYHYRERNPDKAERLRPVLEGLIPLDTNDTVSSTAGSASSTSSTGTTVGKLHFTNMHRLNEMETAYEVARVAEEHLRNGRWVVVVVNFVAARGTVGAALAAHWPGAVIAESGALADHEIAEFQAGRHRFIVGTYAMLKQSRDLDDQLGTRPTTMVRTPVASSISDRQVAGRTERITTRSSAINVVVCARGSVEERIYQLREDKRDPFFG